MKTLLSVLVVLAVACPLHADTVVFQENFDGTVGTAVDSWNGWTLANGTTGQISISDTTLDAGNSAAWAGAGNWPQVSKGFTYTPAAGEQYVLTGTLSAPGGGADAYSDLRITAGGKFLQIAAGMSSGVLFGDGATDVRTPMVGNTMDVRMEVRDTSLHGYARAHGTSAWTDVGVMTLQAGYEIANYNGILQVGQGNGGIDSIMLTASPVPEPTTALLLGTGVLGLLAYAWRRRK